MTTPPTTVRCPLTYSILTPFSLKSQNSKAGDKGGGSTIRSGLDVIGLGSFALFTGLITLIGVKYPRIWFRQGLTIGS